MSRLVQSVLLFSGLLAAGLFISESTAEARRCPPGWYKSRGVCVRAGTRRVGPGRRIGPARRVVHCPAGFHRDAYNRCVRNARPFVRHNRPCGVGFYRDAYGRCIRRAAPIARPRHYGCGVGYYRDAYGRCIRRGATYVGGAATCGAGWYWSNYYKRCVRRRVATCPPGTHWNGYRCRSWRRCPPGQYYSTTYNTCRVAYTNCPYGYRYRAGWGCQRICPTGWYFSGGQCHQAATACPSGTYYNYATKTCRPACGPGRYWSYRKQRCRRVRW